MRYTTPCLLALATLTPALWADVPANWTLRVIARDGNANTALNLPADSTFLQSGIANDPALDADGTLAIRYTYQASTPNRLDAFLLAPLAGTPVGIMTGTPNVLYSGTLDFKNNALLMLTQGLIGSCEVRDETGALIRAAGIGGPLPVYSSITAPHITPDGDVLYRATAGNGSGGTTVRHVIDRGTGPDRTQVSLADSIFPGPYSLLYPPASNDQSVMVSKVWFRNATQTYGVVRFAEGQPHATLFDLAASPAYDSLNDQVALGNGGHALFWARRAGAFQWDLIRHNPDSTRTTIAQAGTRYSNAGFAAYNARVNPEGWAAFRAEQLSGGPLGHALFVGDGASTVRIAGDGTTLTLPTGGTVTIGYGPPTNRYAITGNFAFTGRRLAFLAKLSDNSNALVLAEAPPATTPACGPADMGGQGGTPTPDGLLNNNDFVVFIDRFFAQHPTADLGRQGGLPGSDTRFDNNDFVAFIDAFFAGC